MRVCMLFLKIYVTFVRREQKRMNKRENNMNIPFRSVFSSWVSFMVVTETYLSTTSVLPIPNWRWTGTGMLPLFNLQLPIGIG